MFQLLENTSLLILAAGASIRMGRPKQQLVLPNGKTLLQHCIEEANPLELPMIVVLGANAEAITEDLAHTNVSLLQNDHWQDGMSTSIKIGLALALEQNPKLERLMIMLGDQPLLTSVHFRQMLNNHAQSGLPMTAAGYDDTMGAPVIFHRSMFGKLEQLEGDRGARVLLRKAPELVNIYECPEASMDLDTEADYARYLALNS